MSWRFLSIAAALLAAAVPGTASATVYTIVSAPTALPSSSVPNSPGSVTMPFDLSAPPVRPAVRSYDQLLALWQRAGQDYGVPWQVIAAINKIESNFGQNMGPSSAGAVGWMQFMPSTWLRWGMDGDGDGLADPWNPEDAVYAAARYLAAAGAHEDIERAVFAYNHADWYVDDVLELAAVFGNDPLAQGAGEAVYNISDVANRLATARRDVASIRRELRQIARRGDQGATRRLRLERLAGDPTLSDRAFRTVEAELADMDTAEVADTTRRRRLRARLRRALATVQALEDEQAGASLAAPAGATGAALGSGDYVFPVGGGPDVVSVAHTHHDYPAADIAAPEGAPLFALADSTVVDSFPDGNGNCGIGFALRTEPGDVFLYCHLSSLEPSVVPGAALAAGAPVGRVGATGHATGPHLHLQFVPAVGYPQAEPWFQAFAGLAFSWQDAPTPERASLRSVPSGRASTPARPGPVFRVVRARVIHFTPQ
jgi:murein DD-endopeptidase MepM/ murein hydrolase activator NlpD